jgi:hypothetical protein
MSSATFAAEVTAAFAAYYREQDMLKEHVKGVTEHARLTKELTDELGRSNGPPRREDRSDVPGERSEVPRHRGRDDDYDQQFRLVASQKSHVVTVIREAHAGRHLETTTMSKIWSATVSEALNGILVVVSATLSEALNGILGVVTRELVYSKVEGQVKASEVHRIQLWVDIARDRF